MTIAAESTPSKSYACNGVATDFPTTFQFLAKDDLVVVFIPDDPNIAEITLALDTHYSVSGGDGETGTITTIGADPLGNDPYDDGGLIISRETPLTQQIASRTTGAFEPPNIERAFDKLTMIVQELQMGDVGPFYEWWSDQINAYQVNPEAPDQGVNTEGSIKNLVDAIGTTKKAKLICYHTGTSNETTYTLTTNETIPSNISLEMMPGAVLDGAGTLTQNGPFEAGLTQCFGSNITVTFGSGAVKEGYAEWWATNTTPGTTNMYAAIQAAVTAFEGKGIKLKGLGTTYYVSTDDDIDITDSIIIEGMGWDTIYKNGRDQIMFLAQDATNEIPGIVLRDFKIDMNGHGQLDAGAIQLNNCAGFLVDHVWITGGTKESGASGINGIACAQSTGTYGSKGTIQNCLIENMSKPGIYAAGGSAATNDSSISIINNIVRDINHTTNPQSGSGIACLGSWHTLIDGNVVTNTSSIGIAAQSGAAGTADYPFGVTIINNRIYSCGVAGGVSAHGIQLANAHSLPNIHALVANNWTYNNGVDDSIAAYGILIQNSNHITVTENRAHNNYSSGIYFDDVEHLICEANKATNNNQANGGAGSGFVFTDVDDAIIQGNEAYDYQGTKTQKYGMYFSSSGSYQLIVTNNLRGNATNAFNFAIMPTSSRVLNNIDEDETISSDSAVHLYGVSYLDSSGGVLALTLADGLFPGQQKLISMQTAGNNADVTIAHHETNDDEVARFDAVDEYLLLTWTGTEWATINNTCTFP